MQDGKIDSTSAVAEKQMNTERKKNKKKNGRSYRTHSKLSSVILTVVQNQSSNRRI